MLVLSISLQASDYLGLVLWEDLLSSYWHWPSVHLPPLTLLFL